MRTPKKISIVLSSLFISLFISLSLQAQSHTGYVNPFIGTAGGGNTFPGAVLPWGMVSVSPHSDPSSPSGYIHGRDQFFGFGHNHLSGTGCADLGSIIVAVTRDSVRTSPHEYQSSTAGEHAEPGYYSVILREPFLRAEATATVRSGMIRFTAQAPSTIQILVDVGRSLALVGGGVARIISGREVEGYNISGGFCGEANRAPVYFVARFSKTARHQGTWLETVVSSDHFVEAGDASVGAWLTFPMDSLESVIVKVGLSYVSIDNARLNLETEIPGWDFDRARADAGKAWETELSRIAIEDTSAANKTKFYTALYHTLIHPSVISDVNGEYPLMGRTGIGRYNRRDRYSVFSLWDTYRTLHPFLTLVYPERQSAMIQTMIDMARESGWLPKWELISNETYMMVGDPAAIVIADSYVKGIRDFDVDAAYTAVKKPATELTPAALAARPGYPDYLQYGYIPAEQDTSQEWWVWGPVSTTLEYALADWSIAQMALALGKRNDAVEFGRRSLFYKNLFDPVESFMRPRSKTGEWSTPFDPLQTEGSGDWLGSGGPGYVEGNAWNYTWFVPHDVNGLVGLFGGHRPFTEKLERSFRENHFTITNEPDIAYPYLFTYIPGAEHRTAFHVTRIMERDFRTGADGLPGNDDCGTISAWFIFSALGFYPACPASENYQLGTPLFSKATVKLDRLYYPGDELVIERRTNRGVSGDKTLMRFGGRLLDTFQVGHRELVRGGSLIFERRDWP